MHRRYLVMFLNFLMIFGCSQSPVFCAENLNGNTLFKSTSSKNSQLIKLKTFMSKYCYDCHDDDVDKGGVNLTQHQGGISSSTDAEFWIKILDQVRADLMPPVDKKKRPEMAERLDIVNEIQDFLFESNYANHYKAKLFNPEYGNYVDHNLLFSGKIKEVPFTPARLWRYSPEAFLSKKKKGKNDAIRAPFGYTVSKSEFQDYSYTSIADQGTVESIIQAVEERINNELIKALGGYKKGRNGEEEFQIKVKGNPKHIYNKFTKSGKPSREDCEELVRGEFKFTFSRNPTKLELEKYVTFLSENVIDYDANIEAMKAVIMAINLSPEAVYRMELGGRKKDEFGRYLLSEEEMAFALSYALSDLDPFSNKTVLNALKNGDLKSREGISKTVSALLGADSKEYLSSNPRIFRFFEQYFNYDVDGVFKDVAKISEELAIKFPPKRMTQSIKDDFDAMLRYYVGRDKEVLNSLLTTDGYFIQHSGDNERNISTYKGYFESAQKKVEFHKKELEKLNKLKKDELKGNERAKYLNDIQQNTKKMGLSERKLQDAEEIKKRGLTPVAGPQTGFIYIRVYNLPHGDNQDKVKGQLWSYPIEQPVKLENRKGVLTHPAWLWSHSTNFENDPVHRGIWIYKKLLAGILADVPPNVDAKVPEDPHRTLRERLDVIREDECWKCHRKINPLGEAFENFDDFGRYRENLYFDNKSGEIVHGRGKTFQKMLAENSLKKVKVNSSVDLDEMKEDYISGKVNNSFELIDKLSKMPRVRQSFVRHAFRYFMGRNEMLSDSATLIAAEKAYVDNGGSFKALVHSLLTSDSFIYRK